MTALEGRSIDLPLQSYPQISEGSYAPGQAGPTVKNRTQTRETAMYQVLEVPARRLVAEAGDRDEVLNLLDAECRRLHEEAAANPDAPEAVYRFDVVSPEGREIAWLTYSP